MHAGCSSIPTHLNARLGISVQFQSRLGRGKRDLIIGHLSRHNWSRNAGWVIDKYERRTEKKANEKREIWEKINILWRDDEIHLNGIIKQRRRRRRHWRRHTVNALHSFNWENHFGKHFHFSFNSLVRPCCSLVSGAGHSVVGWWWQDTCPGLVL